MIRNKELKAVLGVCVWAWNVPFLTSVRFQSGSGSDSTPFNTAEVSREPEFQNSQDYIEKPFLKSQTKSIQSDLFKKYKGGGRGETRTGYGPSLPNKFFFSFIQDNSTFKTYSPHQQLLSPKNKVSLLLPQKTFKTLKTWSLGMSYTCTF